jgi:predicted negative regulator of RcsB-dependent stress response
MAAAYAMARGDVLLAADRREEARLAYEAAAADLDAGAAPPATLMEKLDFLSPRQAPAPEAG